MENTTSPRSSCISPAAAPVATSMSAGESSWAMHFADFLASSNNKQEMMGPQGGFLVSSNNRQEMGGQGRGASESSFSSGFSSSFDSLDDEDDSFITSDLMDEDDKDDSLQDTACSSAARPKITSMYDLYMKSMATMNTKEMNTTQMAKYILDAGSRHQATAGAVQEVFSGGNNNEKQLYECSDLRKKGLCLVPLSMLIDYLG